MPTRDSAPIGSPCWADLWTSDVADSRKFYGDLFGWEAQEPSPEFGGYFMFTRNGVPTAGGMGDMGEMAANNSWKIYLHTDDIAKTLRRGQLVVLESTTYPRTTRDVVLPRLANRPGPGRSRRVLQTFLLPGSEE